MMGSERRNAFSIRFIGFEVLGGAEKKPMVFIMGPAVTEDRVMIDMAGTVG
jgi:hypothetical protein